MRNKICVIMRFKYHYLKMLTNNYVDNRTMYIARVHM